MTNPKTQSITCSIKRKIPGGKLVDLEVTFSDRIESVKLMGDFFLHPEETLEDLVNAIHNTPLPLDSSALTARLDQIMANHGAEFMGVSTADITSIIEEAVSCKLSA